MSDQPLAKVPHHVAIIMDGNGRWAASRQLSRNEGHRAGVENIRRVLEGCVEYGVRILTVYAFSTENWSRPADEVGGLLEIFREVIRTEMLNLHENGVRLCHLGRTEGLPPDLKQAIAEAVELTRNNSRITLNVAFNYGGRAEIVDAVRRLADEGVPSKDIDEDSLSRYLYTSGQPDPDLVIRTAGEMRLSNFLLWQAAYAEYYATPTYWPDFDRERLYEALQAYAQRERRFGKVVAG